MLRYLSTFVLFLCFFLSSTFAQEPSDIQLSDKLFIQNVNLVSKAGSAPEKSSILIENGIITQVGKNIQLPGNAVIIKGDSLYAYPAFIDPCSHTGIPKAEKEKQKSVDNPDKPGYERAGITPNLTIESQLKMTDSSVEDMRKVGFAISHAVPRGRMLAGQGSIILLKNADDNHSSFLKKDISMYGSLRSASGRVYPSTVIAVMAKYRNLVMNARNAQIHEKNYKNNPLGLQRPDYPVELQSLYPLVNNKKTLFMRVGKTLDISRAITLNKDLGLNLILVETKQSWPNISKIESLKIPMLLSLDIPEDMKEEKKDSTKVIDPKMEAMLKRKKETISQYQNQTKIVSKHGIPFSFSYFKVKPKEIHDKFRILIDKGMGEDVLLHKLTIAPAEILGIDKMAGTIEKGKLGNIILCDKLIFDEDNNIEFMVVEGTVFEYEKKKKKKKKKDGDTAVNLVGTWDITIDVPDDEQSIKVTFQKDGDEYSGTMMDSEDEEYELKKIELDGNELSFKVTIKIQGMPIKVEGTIEIDEDDMTGSLSVGIFGSFPMEGTRMDKPENY